MSEIAQYSEYIYRYLDGDLSEVESTVLFNVLSHDSSLQREFNDALIIRSTAQYEAKNTVVPTALTTKVLQSANVGIVSRGTSMGRLLSYAGVLVLGFVLSQLVNTMQHHQQSALVSAVNNGQSRYVAEKPSAVKSPVADREAITVVMKSSEQTVVPISLRHPKLTGSEVVNESRSSRHEIMADASEPSLAGAAPILNLSTVEVREDVPKETLWVGDDSFERIMPQYIDSKPLTEWGSFSLSVRRMIVIATSDERQRQTKQLDNVAASITYDLDEYHRIGIEAGTETFPLFIEQEDGTVASRESLRWLGASYGLLIPLREDNSFNLTSRLVVAGAKSGPVVRFGAGIEWRFLPSISLHTIAEGSEILIQNNDHWSGIHRAGIAFGITHHF